MAKIKKTGRHTGAIKTARQSLRRRLRNYKKKEEMKSLVKTAVGAVGTKDQTKAEETFRKYASQIDKAIKTGLLHWRTGARKKSSLARLVGSLRGKQTAAAAS
ncbi:MAG: 30S ribosomal protein S20 [Elusimicrobia bacterium]|nr:30S ribosomal protein S20 [Elusimicrobiota bacterium]